MSKLDELIAEFCPNGVEYKTIDEIAVDIYRGCGIKRDQVTEKGIPCVRYGEIYTTYGVWFEKCKSHTKLEYVKSPKYFEHGDILFAITGESVEDIAKCCAYIGNEKCLAGGDIVVLKHKEDPKYISYALSTVDAQRQKSSGKVKSKVVHSSVPSIKAIKLPVPPLEIQREIVHILDSFTLLTDELTAELTARKKQYEYYRDNILKKEQHISEVKKLADVANIYDSLHQTPSYSNSGYSMVRVQDIKGGYVDEDKTLKVDESVWNLFTQKYTPRLNDIVVSRVGSYGNFALISNDKCCLGQNVALIHPNINPKYLYHVLMSTMTKQWINNNVKGASQKSFSLADIKRVPVPVPKENIQQRIAEVLDNFEAICTDLNIGLPAEIEARQKQYEYYLFVVK